MRALLLLLILLGQACCILQEAPNPPYSDIYIGPQFDAYLKRIEPFLDISSVNIKLDLDYEIELENVAGVCRVDKNLILINPDYWVTYDASKRTALLAHELIHCLYKVTHVHEEVNDAFQLMSPYLYESDRCLRRYSLEQCIETALDQIEVGTIGSVYE